MSLQTVEGLWQQFSQKVLHPSSPEIQRVELRRAFYAGFYGCIIASVEIADICPTEEGAAAEFQKLDDECRAFAAAVLGGEA